MYRNIISPVLPVCALYCCWCGAGDCNISRFNLRTGVSLLSWGGLWIGWIRSCWKSNRMGSKYFLTSPPHKLLSITVCLGRVQVASLDSLWEQIYLPWQCQCISIWLKKIIFIPKYIFFPHHARIAPFFWLLAVAAMSGAVWELRHLPWYAWWRVSHLKVIYYHIKWKAGSPFSSPYFHSPFLSFVVSNSLTAAMVPDLVWRWDIKYGLHLMFYTKK